MFTATSIAKRDKRFEQAQWRVLGAIMICYLFFYTGRQNLGFAVKGMQEELAYSTSAIAWLNAAMLTGYGLGQAINGNLADMYGARRLVAIGASVSFALNWAMSFAGAVWMSVGLWFVNGLFQSTGSPALRRLIVNWFPQSRRGMANGFHLLSAGFSSSLTFGLCILSLQALGWRWVFRLPVTTILLGTALFLMFARNRPSDMGFEELPPEDSEAPEAGDESPLERFAIVVRNPHFLLACLSIGFESMARYGLLSWVPVHFLGAAKGSGVDLWVTLGLPIGMAVGALSAGVFTDRWFPERRAHVAAALMACAALATFWLSQTPKNSPFAFLLLGVAGFFVYAPQASYWALGPVLSGRERSGTSTGLMDAAAYGFAALGQVAIGAAIEWTGSTFSVFVVIAAACLLGALVILPVKK